MTTIPLEVSGPLPARPMLAALAAHSLAGVQETRVHAGADMAGMRGAQAGVPRGSVRRVLELAGRRAPIEVMIADGAVTLVMPDGEPPDAVGQAVATVRRWLDLDLEPAHIDAALGTDPRIGPLLRMRPGLRIVGHPDPFEAAVTTILGQRVSLAAARSFGARFVQFFDDDEDQLAGGRESMRAGAAGREAGLRLFPSPARVAAADPVTLRAAIGVTTVRARAVVALAATCEAGLDLTGPDHEEIRARLLALPGIGPWSVEYLAVRVLGDRDAYPAGDLVLQRALGVDTAAAAEKAAQSWRPWRAYALFHLWTQESYDRPGKDAPREPTQP